MYVRKSTSSKIAEYIRCMLIWWIHATFRPLLHLQSASILVAPFFRRAMAMITSTKRPYQWWTLDVFASWNLTKLRGFASAATLAMSRATRSCGGLRFCDRETRKTYGHLARLGVKRYLFPFIKKAIKIQKNGGVTKGVYKKCHLNYSRWRRCTQVSVLGPHTKLHDLKAKGLDKSSSQLVKNNLNHPRSMGIKCWPRGLPLQNVQSSKKTPALQISSSLKLQDDSIFSRGTDSKPSGLGLNHSTSSSCQQPLNYTDFFGREVNLCLKDR